MILSNAAIFEALDDGRLVIEPQPTPRLQQVGGPESPFGTSAIDLRLGPYLSLPKSVPQVVIDLSRPGNIYETLSGLSETIEIDETNGFQLEPNRFILGQTLETVRLSLPQELEGAASEKPALAARVEGKSSRARFGLLVHFTAPTIHAGWNGRITLEIMCLGRVPLKLYQGLPICQLIIEEVDGIPVESESQFEGQSLPTGEQ